MIVPSLAGRIDFDGLLDGSTACSSPAAAPTSIRPAMARPPTRASEPYDPARDASTLPLIRAAIARGVPLLAICRGMQELNVALGGTLIPEVQEIEGRNDHRAPVSDDQDVRFAIRQDVIIVPGGALAGIVLGRASR